MTFSISAATTLRWEKSGLLKILRKDAFGEQVLHEHALDSFFGEIGIDGLAAERVEVFEDVAERWILPALFFDQALDLLREFGNAHGELFYGL
ncbi:MAG TPA: hypothetical protein VFO39_19035 [Candidatus Sulfotelmatobacter sp.]|nr:hypothetical protein [Candidatus Sulfotelmatobacter sp.]